MGLKRKDVEELSNHDPIVGNFLELVKQGLMNYEEALENMVLALKANEEGLTWYFNETMSINENTHILRYISNEKLAEEVEKRKSLTNKAVESQII